MTYILPPLNALRAFEAAARHLSFKLAAHELHVTPAAVGQQVKALEERLGVRLFERLHKQLILTPAGLIFLRVGKRQPKLIEHHAGKSCVGSRCTNVAIGGKNRDHEISKIR